MASEEERYQEAIRGLEMRVEQLGAEVSEIKRVEIKTPWGESDLELRNIPGSRLSLKLLRAHAGMQDSYSIKKEEARKLLRVYGPDLLFDATQHPGKHKMIDLLTNIATCKLPEARVKFVHHDPVETLPKDKEEVIRTHFGCGITPAYLYFENQLEQNMQELMEFPAPFGLTVRYAMKANSHSAILRIFNNMGAHFDVSSLGEAQRLMHAAHIPGKRAQLTSQVVPSKESLTELLKYEIDYTACSLRQLEIFGQVPESIRGRRVAVRFNPGIGSGWTKQTSTGGLTSSFGIYEHRDEIKALLERYNLELDMVHLHIGSGADPKKQEEAARLGIGILEEFPTATRLSLGGGIKEARMGYETRTDIQDLGKPVAEALREFAVRTGRKIHLEIEPGTRAVANAVYLIGGVMDIVDTGQKGYTFVKLNIGMPHLTRPMLYGAQHPIFIVPRDKSDRGIGEYVFVGPCCESGDLLSPRVGKAEEVDVRRTITSRVGDIVAVGGAGAYTESMPVKNYNSFVDPMAFLARKNGRVEVIRGVQGLRDLWVRERIPSDLMGAG